MNGWNGGADHLNAVFFQNSQLGHLDSGVQTGLPAKRRQYGAGPLPFNNLGDGLRRNWFDIGSVGHVRISHDSGGVAVDQHHLITFFLQCLACLGAGIIKFTALADDDGTCADDQDFMNVCAFGHIYWLAINWMNSLKRY